MLNTSWIRQDHKDYLVVTLENNSYIVGYIERCGDIKIEGSLGWDLFLYKYYGQSKNPYKIVPETLITDKEKAKNALVMLINSYGFIGILHQSEQDKLKYDKKAA